MTMKTIEPRSSSATVFHELGTKQDENPETTHNQRKGLTEAQKRLLKKFSAATGKPRSEWRSWMTEWRLIYVYREKNHCECGRNILNCCRLQNSLNGAELIVGNVCIEFIQRHNKMNMPDPRLIQACIAQFKAKNVDLLEIRLDEDCLLFCEQTGILHQNQVSKYCSYLKQIELNVAAAEFFVEANSRFRTATSNYPQKCKTCGLYCYAVDRGAGELEWGCPNCTPAYNIACERAHSDGLEKLRRLEQLDEHGQQSRLGENDAKIGHFVKDCPNIQNTSIECYNCKRLGHYANNCPSRNPYVDTIIGHFADGCSNRKRPAPSSKDSYFCFKCKRHGDHYYGDDCPFWKVKRARPNEKTGK
jgi:hypothetical protein